MGANLLWIAVLCISSAASLRLNTPGEAEMDVVMVSEDLDCVSQYSIQKLQEHVKHRKIYFITKPRICENTKDELPEGVECVSEDEAVPGLSRKAMKTAFSKMDRFYRSKLAGRTGWFLQQFLKLAYPLSNPDISEDFLAIDSDLFATRNLTLYKDRLPVLKSGGHHSHVSKQYEEAYNFLSGGAEMLTPKHASEGDTSSYNVHHMLFRKAWVNEMLNQFGNAVPWDPLQVTQSIFEMQNFPKFAQAAMMHASQKNHTKGFSEYTMYASWVQTHHGEEVAILSNHSGPTLRKQSRFCKELEEQEDCCPADHMFAKDFECYGSELSGLEGHKSHTPEEVEKGFFASLPFFKNTPECKTPQMQESAQVDAEDTQDQLKVE